MSVHSELVAAGKSVVAKKARRVTTMKGGAQRRKEKRDDLSIKSGTERDAQPGHRAKPVNQGVATHPTEPT